jgi:hypothetical protein
MIKDLLAAGELVERLWQECKAGAPATLNYGVKNASGI